MNTIGSMGGSLVQSISQSALNALSASATEEEEEEKTTAEILQELKQDGSSMTAQEIADEYGITISEAEKILEQLEGTAGQEISDYGILETVIPEGSTVSYQA